MTILFSLALLASGTTGFAESDEDRDTATRHLRACVTSGARGAQGSLAENVQAVRALCGHQIRVVRSIEEREIDRQNPAPRTSAEEDRVSELKHDAAIRLNNEIARLIATLTGNTQ